MSTLTLLLLGPPRVEQDSEPLTINRRKVLALLIYLALSPHPQRRNHLAALLWPGYDDSSARGNFRRALSDLNRTLNGSWLRMDGEQVSLARSDDFWLDVDAFQHSLSICTTHDHSASEVCADCLDPLRQAIDLYQDDFLSGFSLSDSPEFDDWQLFQRESLRREMTEALEKLAQGLSAQRKFESAAQYVRRWLALDPLQEAAHRQLMWLLAAMGQRNAALVQYQTCAEIVRSEIGLEPTAETTALFEQIRRGEIRPMQQETRKLAQDTPRSPRMAPPPVHPSFIGREREIEEIVNLLRNEPTCQLLTLVGMGGMGKTSLALKVAQHCADDFADGICFVALTDITSRSNLITSIANALALPLTSADAAAQVRGFLRDREILLLLDNLEQLLPSGGVELLSDLVVDAQRVQILVTSRERLNLQHEWVFPVNGLHSPGRERRTAAEVADYEAVKLFQSCARRVDANFSLSNGMFEDVATICHILAGMPLAILLAASWLRVMSIHEIADEIKRSIDFLTTSLRDLPERHHSVSAVLQQSWELLSPKEQRLLRGLSVFRGGFQRTAAERITEATPSLLAALMDKSLLKRSRSGRYEIHSLIRQFAGQQLPRSPQQQQVVQSRYRDYYARFIQQITGQLKGRHDIQAAEEISVELENVRSVWQQAIAALDWETLSRMAEGLLHFYETKGWYQEEKEIFSSALAALEPNVHSGEANADEIAVLAQLHASLGAALVRCGELDLARQHIEQSIGLMKDWTERPDLKALAYNWLGHYYIFSGLYEDATHAMDTARALFAEADDQWGMAASLAMGSIPLIYGGKAQEAATNLSEALHILRRLGGRWLPWTMAYRGLNNRLQGSYADAMQDLSEANRLASQMGLTFGQGYCRRELAYLAIAGGQYEEARTAMQAALDCFQEAGTRVALVFPLDGLGTIARLTEDYTSAQEYHTRSLRLAEEMGERRGMAMSLNSLGRLAYVRRDYAQAQRMHRESLERYQELGNPHGIASALCRLGYTTCALADADRAWAYLHESFAVAHEINAMPQVMEILVGAVHCFILDDLSPAQEKRAAELLRFVLNHPASQAETRRSAEILADRFGIAGLVEAVEAYVAGTDPVGNDRLIELWEQVIAIKPQSQTKTGP